MKTLNLFLKISLFTCVLIIASCDPHSPATCRISKFFWEDQWHQAYYNSSGRLAQLVADSSKIVFHYDASNRLVKAEIYRSAPDPKYWFEFINGPSGIIESNEYHHSPFGIEHTKHIFHYTTPTRVDYIIRQEFGIDITPGFEIRYDLSYVNNNVSFINGTSSVINTGYTATRYDKKQNPFKILASAVGNPVFFPVCFFANFPVSLYDISFLNILSNNNPLRAQYEIPGSGLDPQMQIFTNTYAGSIAKKIVWDDTSYGSTTSEDYEFEFDCGTHASSGE